MSIIYAITDPSQSNATFTRIFNDGRDIEAWLTLYEPGATLLYGPEKAIGKEAIRGVLTELAQAPGEMHSCLNFCEINGDIAVTRADSRLVHEGKILTEASSIEILRRQPDGQWLFVIDLPLGASLPSVWSDQTNES